MNPRRVLTFLVSLTITAVFLGLALYQVDFGKLTQALASADYVFIGVAACFTCTGYILRTMRWRRFLAPSKRIPFTHLFPILVAGFALNNLLPGRPGEFARPYALGRREGLAFTLAFGTVVLERVADGIALIAFLLIALAAFHPLGVNLPPVVETIAAFAVVLFGVALAGLVFLLWRESLALSLFRRLTRWLPRSITGKVEQMLGSFTLGLHALRSPADLAAIFLASLGVWACEGASYLLVLTAFRQLPNVPERAVAAVFMMVLINLGIMIPAAPGGLGPFEAAGVFALSAFGVTSTFAATVALTAHTMQYLLITVLGLIFVWRGGISLVRPPRAKPEPE